MAQKMLEYDLDLFTQDRRWPIPVGMHNAETAYIRLSGLVGVASGAIVTLESGMDAGDAQAINGGLILGGTTTIAIPGDCQRVIVDSMAFLILRLTSLPSTPASAIGAIVARAQVLLRGSSLTEVDGRLIGPVAVFPGVQHPATDVLKV